MFKKLIILGGLLGLLFSVDVSAENITLLPDADTKTYTVDDIANMDLQTMCFARNEVYARHGRKFVSQELQEWFNKQEWYNGTIEPKDFPENLLNKTEQANVTMMWEYELSKTDGKGYPVDDVTHRIQATTVDQLGQDGGWDYSAVYAYLGMTDASGAVADQFDILSGLEIYTANGLAVMDADNFYMTLPTNPKVGYYQNDNTSFTIYYALAKNNGYDGKVVTIKAYDIGDNSYTQLPSYRILGVNDTKVFIGIFPTDAQFNGVDPTQTSEYGMLLNWVTTLDYNSANSSFKGVNKQQDVQQEVTTDNTNQDSQGASSVIDDIGNAGVGRQIYDYLSGSLGG